MIVELGHYALVLAFLTSLIQAGVPKAARAAPGLLLGLIFTSFLSLTYAYVTSDFSVMNVVKNSHTMKPLLFKIAGVWGNHEGSMLLWVLMLSFWGFLAARAGKTWPQAFFEKTVAVQGMLAAGFLSFILFTSNPFKRLAMPVLEGLDLNPLLQDPALALHPPFLYAGYVGFSVAFAFAVAALWTGDIDRAWAQRLRPWVLSAWGCLTVGIALGSFWAYYELGWGGFWFWDPVENASLLPWLCGTALLHSVVVSERRGTLFGWTLFLSILAFSLSLLGTFLVRSGVLTSVHAFASDPMRGIFILALLGLATGGALLLYALRAPALDAGKDFAPVSRETILLLNNVFLFTFTATVFIGTLYPVFMSALDIGAVSVGAPYYKTVLVPMLLPFMILMGVALYVPWQKAQQGFLKKSVMPALLAAMFLLLPVATLAKAGFAAAAWVCLATAYDFLKKRPVPRRYKGMSIAHIGFAVFVAGVTGATQLSSEKILWMLPSDRVTVAGTEISFLGTESILGKNYNADQGIFTVRDKFLTPEKRWYPAAEKETTESALMRDGLGVLYVVLGDTDEKNAARRVVRVYHHPLFILIFAGALLMALGGVVAASDRKAKS